MIAPYILDKDGTLYSFVGCLSRLGNVTRVGPVTGQNWPITPRGSWVEAQDAEELVNRKEPVWCFREQKYILMQAIMYLDPTADQIKNLTE